MEDSVRDREVDHLLENLSNWGRWGPGDELGTLNTITPALRKAALQSVELGRPISLARRLSPRHEIDNPKPMQHFMLRTGTEASTEGFSSSADWIGLEFHGFAVTHLDALSHVHWKGRMYNGLPARRVSAARGATAYSIEVVRHGITGRGVLLDIPRHRRAEWVDLQESVNGDELAACAKAQNVTVGAGDILLVRFGRDVRRKAKGPHDFLGEGSPGLSPVALPWLRERDIALLGSDVAQDVMFANAVSHLMPVHIVSLVGMGLYLLDNAYLEDLAEACAERRRWDFLFTLAPLVLQQSTGSPVNPLALV